MAGRLTPNRIGRTYVKVLLQLISRYDSRLGPILTRTAFIADLRTQSFITHELGDSVRSTVLTQTRFTPVREDFGR